MKSLTSPTRSPTVYISHDTMSELRAFALASPLAEVSGYGAVTIVQSNDGTTMFLLEKVVLAEHASNASLAIVDGNEAAKAFDELLEQGFDFGQVRVQWHSHLGMAYFSDTDMTACDEPIGDYFLYLVVNGRGDVRARIDIYRPIRIGLECPVVVEAPPIPHRILQRAAGEVNLKQRLLKPKKTNLTMSDDATDASLDTQLESPV